ncbi:hypothetical protein BGW36DRAFT_423073 [Talaromyces proteolyticus]|uniref:Mid2 domain-containing protein n=1 Tax=Talaromyces proteolyticus TaxID=1131652 RepID=A0AAD4L4P1_9EURO|nr:uncharacterized protein BGW36DRAFT_423073 [Talaromyces proteolyticus]KAH8703512.1 hypothetical protein BGW36DRAFT_423073 [Talaromyces proteolyticus]
MRLLPVFAFLSPLCASLVSSDAVFTNPPPFAQSGYEATQNPVYATGSTLQISWTTGSAKGNTSLALFQLNGTTSMYPYEFLANNQGADVTSLAWTVQTDKNLTISNMFWMCLFPEGSSDAEACTHFFNITGGHKAGALMSAGPDSSSSLGPITMTASSMEFSSFTTTFTSSPTSIAQSASMPTVVAVSTSASSTITSSSPAPDSTSSALTTVEKAGLGVGVSVGALFAVGGGWLAFSRWRKWRETPVETNARTRNYIYGYSREKLDSMSRISTPHSGWN